MRLLFFLIIIYNMAYCDFFSKIDKTKIKIIFELGSRDLMDAIKEFPVDDRTGINHSKFGWLIAKNANRIVGGLEFQEGWADGRKAWCVMVVKSPPSLPIPALPPLNPSSGQSVTPTVEVEI